MSGGLINQMPFLRFVAPEKSGYNTLMATINTNYSFLRVPINDLTKNTTGRIHFFIIFQETLTEHKQNFEKGNHSDLIDAYLDEIENKQDDSGSANFHGMRKSIVPAIFANNLQFRTVVRPVLINIDNHPIIISFLCYHWSFKT